MTIATDWIGNSGNMWIVILTMFIPMVLGAIIGYAQGKKTAIYYSAWMIVGWLIAAITFFFSDFAKLIVERFDSKSLELEGADEILASVINKYGGLIFGLLFFITELIVLFIAFIVGLFVRKRLKSKIIENKELGLSSTGYRWWGAGIGVLTSIPLAVSMTAVATITTTKSALTQTNSGLLKAMSFGKTDTLTGGEDLKTTLELVDAMKEAGNIIDAFEAAFSGGTNGDTTAMAKAIEENKDLLIKVFNSKLLIEALLPTIVSQNSSDAAIDHTAPPDDSISDIFGESLKDVTDENKKLIKKVYVDNLNWKDGATQEQKETWVDELLTKMFG